MQKNSDKTMRLDYHSKRFTLDYDNTTYKQLLAKLFYILLNKFIDKLRYRKSPRKKGYHVDVRMKIPVNVPRMRRKYHDDPLRLVHDLLNRPDHIHDVLWTRKRIEGKIYSAGKWSAWIT